MSDRDDCTVAGDGVSLSTFLEFCAKVRKDDSSVLPEPGVLLRISHLSEKANIELADALLENTNVTYLELETENYTKNAVQAMAKYVRTSKRLQRIRCDRDPRLLNQLEETICCFLSAIQESTSLKELHIDFPLMVGPSNLAFENVLTHTQSLRSLSIIYPIDILDDTAVAAAWPGLKKNTTLRTTHAGMFEGLEGCNGYCLSHFDQSVRPSSPSKAMFAWACGESDWTRDCVAKRHLQNHRT
jgi:hypothetical protein